MVLRAAIIYVYLVLSKFSRYTTQSFDLISSSITNSTSNINNNVKVKFKY